jgi:hypothetical protein
LHHRVIQLPVPAAAAGHADHALGVEAAFLRLVEQVLVFAIKLFHHDGRTPAGLHPLAQQLVAQLVALGVVVHSPSSNTCGSAASSGGRSLQERPSCYSLKKCGQSQSQANLTSYMSKSSKAVSNQIQLLLQYWCRLRHWRQLTGVVATQNSVVTKEKEMANYYEL